MDIDRNADATSQDQGLTPFLREALEPELEPKPELEGIEAEFESPRDQQEAKTPSLLVPRIGSKSACGTII